MILQIYWALQDVIDEFIVLYGTLDLQMDKLTNIEQATVHVIKDFLEKLLMSTKACKSKESTLDLILPSTDYILSLFERLKNEYKDDLTFVSMFNSGQKKMDKYYKLSDKTPAYVVVIVLYPSRKWKWIKKHWKPEQILGVKDKMRTFWETKYKPSEEVVSTPASQLSTTPTQPPNDFLQWLKDDDDDDVVGDEYTRYCNLPQVPGVK